MMASLRRRRAPSRSSGIASAYPARWASLALANEIVSDCMRPQSSYSAVEDAAHLRRAIAGELLLQARSTGMPPATDAEPHLKDRAHRARSSNSVP